MKVVAIVFGSLSVFAIVAVSFLKGDLRQCQGEVFDSAISTDPAFMDLLVYPVQWDRMSNLQQQWFIPSVNNTFLNSSALGTDSISCPIARSDDLLRPKSPCCLAGGFNQDNTLSYDIMSSSVTSKDICLCWGGEWNTVVAQTFDNFPGK